MCWTFAEEFLASSTTFPQNVMHDDDGIYNLRTTLLADNNSRFLQYLHLATTVWLWLGENYGYGNYNTWVRLGGMQTLFSCLKVEHATTKLVALLHKRHSTFCSGTEHWHWT